MHNECVMMMYYNYVMMQKVFLFKLVQHDMLTNLMIFRFREKKKKLSCGASQSFRQLPMSPMPRAGPVSVFDVRALLKENKNVLETHYCLPDSA